MPSLLPIAGIVATLAAIEGIAWWWMNPAAVQGEPVLAYRPRIVDHGSKIEDERIPVPSAIQQSTIDNQQSSISSSSPFQRLPDIYRQAAPMLRCSTGEVFRIDTPDHLTLHLAYFEWNDTDTGSVLEAFRHLPEACMGSLGIKLVSKEKPIRYTVGLDRRLARQSLDGDGAGPLVANGAENQGSKIVDRGSKTMDHSSSKPESTILNQQSSISPSSTPHAAGDKSAGCVNPALPDSNLQSNIHDLRSTISLLFDHTVFTDTSSATPGLQPRVHAFRAVWVSGMDGADARRGIDGHELERLRTIRLKAAATRYRPTHARVIQGTVRGALNAETAWQAFEHHMLRNLTFAR